MSRPAPVRWPGRGERPWRVERMESLPEASLEGLRESPGKLRPWFRIRLNQSVLYEFLPGSVAPKLTTEFSGDGTSGEVRVAEQVGNVRDYLNLTLKETT